MKPRVDAALVIPGQADEDVTFRPYYSHLREN
jgi:hypothetical protein